MRNKLNMVLSCICLILAVICCVLTVRERNENPYFRSENVELVYNEGMSDQDFLEGLSAYDREDGEISNKIVIRSKMKSTESFTVVYIVKDSNDNQADYTRIYQINSEDETQTSVENETSQAESEETESAAEENGQQSVSESGSEISQGNEELVDTNPEAPILVLDSNSAVISAGSSFNYWDYIASVEDNKDDSQYLSSQIVVDGAYNTSVPGTYELKFWVLDSDGNRSASQTLLLIVE